MMYRRISDSPPPGAPENIGEPFMMIAMRPPPSPVAVVRLQLAEHVQQEQQLAVGLAPAGRGRSGRRSPLVVLALDGLGVALPVDAVGRVGDDVVEVAAGEGVLGQLLPKATLSASWPLISMSALQMA